MLNTAQLWGAVEPVVRKHYGLEANKVASEFDKVFDVSKGKEAVRHAMEFGGPGQLQLKPEGSAMNALTMKQGPNKTFLYSVYAGEISISWELARDVNYRAIKTVSQSLGRATRLTPEYLAAQYLDRAFNSAYPATADGKELCATDHLTVGTNAYDLANEMSTPQALSETSLEDILTGLMTMKGPDGMIVQVNPETLIVPAALANTAKKLMSADKTLGSANNDPSIVNRKSAGWNYQVFRFLGSNTRYFVKTDWPNGLFWEWDVEREFMEDNSPTTLTKVYVAFFRARWGADDPRSIYGVAAV